MEGGLVQQIQNIWELFRNEWGPHSQLTSSGQALFLPVLHYLLFLYAQSAQLSLSLFHAGIVLFSQDLPFKKNLTLACFPVLPANGNDDGNDDDDDDDDGDDDGDDEYTYFWHS